MNQNHLPVLSESNFVPNLNGYNYVHVSGGIPCTVGPRDMCMYIISVLDLEGCDVTPCLRICSALIQYSVCTLQAGHAWQVRHVQPNC